MTYHRTEEVGMIRGAGTALPRCRSAACLTTKFYKLCRVFGE